MVTARQTINGSGTSDDGRYKFFINEIDEKLTADVEQTNGVFCALGGDVLEEQVVDGRPDGRVSAKRLTQQHETQSHSEPATMAISILTARRLLLFFMCVASCKMSNWKMPKSSTL